MNEILLPILNILATVVVGGIAIYVYFKEKSDKKRDIATLLVSEIRTTAEIIEEIKNSLSQKGDFPLLPFDGTWFTYSYMFAQDFDRDELDIVNRYFTTLREIGLYIEKNNNFFWISTEQKAKAIQDSAFQLIVSKAETLDINSNDQFDSSIIAIINKVNKAVNLSTSADNGIPGYSPNKPVMELERLLVKLESGLLDTIVFSKLKSISNGKKFKFF